MASREDMQNDFGKVVARTWSDDEFKEQLLSVRHQRSNVKFLIKWSPGFVVSL